MNARLVLSGTAAITFAFFAFYGCGPALDRELAVAGGPPGDTILALPTSSPETGGRTGVGRTTRKAGNGGAFHPASAPTFLYQGRPARWWARRAVQARRDANARGRTIRRLRRELAAREIGPTLAIRLVFGPHAAAALRVSWCESRWWPGARNGQYLGLFQMGDYARGRYGHSGDALGQARAAYAYFAASGFDWSPWACKP